jgi:hypothetical protein
MAIYRVDYFKIFNSKYVMVEANSKREAINKAIEENHWQKYPVDFFTFNYTATLQDRKPKNVSPVWVSVKDELPPVDKEVIVLTTIGRISFGHIVDKKIAKDYNGWNIPDVEYWLPFVDPKDE